MALPINTTEATPATSGTSYTLSIGAHLSGDLLYCAVTQQVGSTPISFWNSSVTVDATADTFTYSGSDYWTDGDQIILSGTTAPTGTTLETTTPARYFVRDLNTGAKTFKIASTSGGAAINVTSTGTAVVANLMTTGTNHPLGSGWRMLGLQPRSGTLERHALAYKIATSASETAPTFYGTSDYWIGSLSVIRDAHETAPFGSETEGTDYKITTFSTGTSHSSPALTSATDGCLLIYSAGSRGTGGTWHLKQKINDVRNLQKFQNILIGQCVSYTSQESAGAAPTVTLYKSDTGLSGSYAVVAIRNKTGGARAPDIRPAVTELYWYGNIGATHDPAVSWSAPTAFATETAGGFSVGERYTIISVGTTDFTLIGASANTVGTQFTATGAGSGTGTAGRGFVGVAVSNTAPTTSTSATSGNPRANWGQFSQLASTETTATLWVGGTHTISSTDFSGKVFGVTLYRTAATTDATSGSQGTLIGFSDGTNWAVFQVQSVANGWVASMPETAFIACGSGASTPYASSGTLNWSAITRIGYFVHRAGSVGSSTAVAIKNAALFGTTALVGGGSSHPATFADYAKALPSWNGWDWAKLQGTAQALANSSLQIGDGGTNTTYFDASASSIEYPEAFSTAAAGQMKWNAAAGQVTLSVKAGASDTINFSAGVAATDTAQLLAIDSGSSTSASYSFVGESFVGWTPSWKTGVTANGATFSECGEIAFAGANVTNCTIVDTVSTDAAAAWSANGATVTDTTIDVTGTSAGYHIELGTSVTAITLNGVTFTGTPGTDKIHALATTGTVTITVDGTGTAITSADVTSAGATISVVSPSVERGLEFTGLIAGSKVKVFTTGADTELFSTASSGTTETWDDATSGSITVDYVVMKAGYLPIRVTGVTVTGAVSTGVVSTPISQTADRAYVASSGLAIGGGTPNVFANTSTKRFGLSTTSTLQNFYSYFIEQWIALGDTGETFANKTFPIVANGPNSFTFHEWEFDTTTYPNSITNLSRDGLRYVDASDTVLATWSAILTSGVPSGARVRYQQVEGTTQSAAVTSGDMDQLVQVYGDATHGNFDRTGYLKLKVQESGYDQIESDAVTLYGTLEDQLYVVGLAPTANGVTSGNPSLANPPTITDHAGSPVTWNSKTFSITITDSAAGNSGEDIMRWLRWYFEQGGTFEGTDAFNWHDLVQVNGSAFKTVRGAVYGDTGATLKGVRVVQNDGTSAHADFDLFTADDGTTYTPPVSYTVTVGPFITGSRVQLYDTANSVELFNGVVTGTSKVYSDTYTVDRTVRVRISYQSGTSAKAFIEATVGTVTSSNLAISYTANQLNDTTYNTNAIDGSTVTGITFTDAATDLVNINIASGSTTWPRIYAAFVAWIYTASGIADDIAYIDAVDPANYLLTSMKVRNDSSPSVPLVITGGFARDATTESIEDIIDITGGNIFPLVDHVVSKVVTVSGVNVITGDIADVPTASEVASAVWSQTLP